MIIRDAKPEDGVAACETMRRSIAELCAADHHDDPAIVQRWLSNKAPETFKSWIRPDNVLLVAAEDDRILAVGCVTSAGEITLNYVAPDARFRGVSSAMLAELEARARARGNAECTLESTETARRFYRARGYVELNSSTAKFGIAGGHWMSKKL
jgi:ribosomal protein S18 acetylase RimI-like enzyme